MESFIQVNSSKTSVLVSRYSFGTEIYAIRSNLEMRYKLETDFLESFGSLTDLTQTASQSLKFLLMQTEKNKKDLYDAIVKAHDVLMHIQYSREFDLSEMNSIFRVDANAHALFNF